MEQKILPTYLVDKTGTSRIPLNLLPYTVTIQENPHWRSAINNGSSDTTTSGVNASGSNGVIKFFSATSIFGVLNVLPNVASKSGLDIVVDSEVCPVISRPIIHSQSSIFGLKRPWSEMTTDIICDEAVARILTENPEYVGQFQHAIYVPDFATAYRRVDDCHPTSFSRLIKWTTK